MKRFFYINENNEEQLDQPAVDAAIEDGSFQCVIGWWSGGVTSAVTCKLLIDIYGVENCRFIFIDTKNEDDDTYRFKADCEKWYGKEIETISRIGSDYDDIKAVWFKYKSLNIANGAICSSELKRELRKKWQKENAYSHQAFGFDLSEVRRAKSISMNYPTAKSIFPLLMFGLMKKDCIERIEEAGIEIPLMYKYGFHNNNCFKTGCVQGSISYWQKMQKEHPEKFDAMAKVEHELTDLKGQPVTCCKDQSNLAKETGNRLVFLKPHKDYPHLKDISMMKGKTLEPMVECNGFCGSYDLEKDEKIEQISNQTTIFDLGA